ncbi:MAG: cell division protein FtsZ [Bacteroidales bacterium]|nr:cell division protein FtsZ [Bacteroidales bacterium]
MTSEDISSTHDFSLGPVASSANSYSPQKIKVIGVGGGGNNAIDHMYNMGVRNVSFIVANTDRQALANSPVPTKVLLGPTTLRGRGAGNRPERARMAAEESAQDIDNLFDDDTDMVFITAGMGGGTGTGASPVIARIARERGLLTIGIVTIPFLFEGQRKILKALDGANEMSKYVDALLVINNERLSEIYKELDFLNAFGKADDILSMAAISISEIVTCDGYINLDFNDVDNTLRDGGTAIISTGYGEGENRVRKAIDDALHSPLLRNTDIFGSRKLLFNLYFSRDADDKFKIDETKQITEFISNIDKDVDVIWGVAFDETLGNKVKFTILAAGFDVTISDENVIKGTDVADGRVESDEIARKTEQRLVQEYGSKMDDFNIKKEEQKYIILKPEQFDDDRMIEIIEQNPAYNRSREVKQAIASAASANPKPASNPQSSNPSFQSGSKTTISFDDF